MSVLSAPRRAAMAELAGLGARGAARALSGLLGVEGEAALTGPEVATLPELLASMGGPASAATAISFRVAGAASGAVLVIFPGGAAGELAGMLLGRPPGDLDATSQSALQEAGNILASAYLNEVARSARVELIPSVPHLIRGRLDSLLEMALEMLDARAEDVVGSSSRLSPLQGPEVVVGHFQRS